MEINKLLFIVSRYPNEFNKTTHVFVQQLVWSLADLGFDCTVIAPVPNNRREKLPVRTSETTQSGNNVNVYFPRYTNNSVLLPFKKQKNRLATFLFQKCVSKCIADNNIKPDIIYGHFITPAGLSAVQIGESLGIPSFFAYGESTPWSIENVGLKWARKKLRSATGIVAVSSQNKETLLSLDIAKEEKIEVFPNAVRIEHFYKRDKLESRKKFGFVEEDFIVSFVGQFNERKGPLRVEAAIEEIEGIKGIYAGSGSQAPHKGSKIYAGKVSPENMPYFLSSADIFVLPTLNEGCCNAIVEAMACGLPIISSDRSFNYDILDKENSIMIDPTSVSDIKQAITILKENEEERRRLGNNSLARGRNLNYNRRAQSIMDWIRKRIYEDTGK
ncbi:glycosyltransferase family 4 protein [Priestia megaterium]|uniref:glycosyltransferase family 4 protein n=1 Tax=Priestia megaterium TaxID=1404 RepID=UPI00285660CB|nr:glycosyltransferase family 4 protein [Priestia megaterium]MDR7204822.1 glycosyltransferase involved in cell wall biosynthesis [Priestia megaterium]